MHEHDPDVQTERESADELDVMKKRPTVDKVRELLEECLNDTRAELLAAETGQNEVSIVRKPRFIARAIERMVDATDTGTSAGPPGIWRPILDTWLLGSEPGKKIIKATLLYEKLIGP